MKKETSHYNFLSSEQACFWWICLGFHKVSSGFTFSNFNVHEKNNICDVFCCTMSLVSYIKAHIRHAFAHVHTTGRQPNTNFAIGLEAMSAGIGLFACGNVKWSWSSRSYPAAVAFPLKQAMLEKVLLLITEAAVAIGIYWVEARATAAWPAMCRALPTT